MWNPVLSRTRSPARRGLPLAAALLLLAQSPICFATIYKCDGQDGATIYADAPCGPDAKPQLSHLQRNRRFHGVARETRAWSIIICYSI